MLIANLLTASPKAFAIKNCAGAFWYVTLKLWVVKIAVKFSTNVGFRSLSSWSIIAPFKENAFTLKIEKQESGNNDNYKSYRECALFYLKRIFSFGISFFFIKYTPKATRQYKRGK